MKHISYLAFLPVILAVCPFAPASADPVLSYTEGNPFQTTGSSGSSALSATQNAWASFTAPETMEATGIRVDLNAIGSATSLTFGIELGSGGVPDGTYVASGTITSQAANFNNEVDFSSDYQLTAGTVYYVVVTATGGTSGMNNWGLVRESPVLPGSTQPYGYQDSNFKRGSNSTPSTGSDVYVVMTNGSYNLGDPVTSNTNTAATSAGLAEHFIFQQPATGNAITSATLTLAIGTSVTAPVTVSLLDSSNTVLATATLAASAFTLSATNNYTFNFNNVVLTPGLTYNLALSTTGTGVSWLTDNTDANAADEAATFQGTQGYAINAAGNAVDNADYIFSYTTAAVPEPSTVMLGTLGLGLLAVMAFRRQKLQA